MVYHRLILVLCTAVLIFISAGCGGGGGGFTLSHTHGVVTSTWSAGVDPTGISTTEDHAEVGYNEVDGRIVSLTLEPSKAMKMWMEMDGMWMWMEMTPTAAQNLHYEVKITDPGSQTRIPHSRVDISIENVSTGASFARELHSMWGGSGLHYAINEGLIGDGMYHAIVTLEEPKFARSIGDKDKWKGSVSTEFHFEVADGLVVAGTISSGTAPTGPSTPVPPHDPATLPSDPATDETFMGEATSENMRIQLILEPAKGMNMWMDMGGGLMWMDMDAMGALYHVEVKPVDEGSGTRLTHCVVTFNATNTTTTETMSEELHGMWGGSGLHYAINHSLFGAGDYTASVVVDPPRFARSLSDGAKWMDPIQADFTFSIDGAGMVTATEGHPPAP